MFSNYLATQKDLKTVEDGLSFVLHPKMQFVLKDKSKIVNTAVISYDSKFIYIWKINPVKLTFKIPHNLNIPDEWQSGWRAGIVSKQIKKYLPDEIKKATQFEAPIISGGLLTPFVALQKEKNVSTNPYTTKESYLATMIHEFGHIYWNSFKLWWPSNKTENIKLFKLVKDLYSGRKTKSKAEIKFPSPYYMGEVFAFCSEYYASCIFWKNHRRNMDVFVKGRMNDLIALEQNKNLDMEDSVIEPTKFFHDFSLTVGRMILAKYPTTWPGILTKPLSIS